MAKREKVKSSDKHIGERAKIRRNEQSL